MWFSPSRMTQSFGHGTSNSSKVASDSCSGRYRATRNLIRSAMRCLLSIHPLGRGPAGNRDREVIDARRPVGVAINQRVRQVAHVVALREIGALMRAARLLAAGGRG